VSKNELEVMISKDGEVDMVRLDGPIDSATIENFKDKLDPLCNKPGAKVLVDCAHLSYLNSRAIGLLVKYHRSLAVSRGRLVFCNLNSKLVRTLELLQLGKALQICESREKAMELMT